VIRDTNFLSTPCIAAVSDVGLHLSGRFGQIGYHYKLQDSTKDVFYSTKTPSASGVFGPDPHRGLGPLYPRWELCPQAPDPRHRLAMAARPSAPPTSNYLR